MSDPNTSATEAARRDLERLRREGETLGGTAMDRASKDLGTRDDEDNIDRLGRKIGRGLAFAVLPFALWYFGRSAGWW